MKILHLLGFSEKGEKKVEKPAGLSGFILHASEKEKAKVFREAGRRANEEQKETFLKSRTEVKV